MKKISARQLTTAAAIAALYTVLSLASSFIPPVGGVFQFRVSEALTILPYFTPAAIPGLFIGCLLSNLITGALPYDLVFGSLATLIAALITAYMGKKGMSKWLAPLPAVVMNALVVGAVLCYGYRVGVSYPVCALYVGAGEAISCYAVGMPLLAALNPIKKRLFG